MDPLTPRLRYFITLKEGAEESLARFEETVKRITVFSEAEKKVLFAKHRKAYKDLIDKFDLKIAREALRHERKAKGPQK